VAQTKVRSLETSTLFPTEDKTDITIALWHLRLTSLAISREWKKYQAWRFKIVRPDADDHAS